MKRFKKKHTKIPSKETVIRLLRQLDEGDSLVEQYERCFNRCPTLLPEPIRVATLAEFDPCKRQNIRYYPDLHNFQLFELPNRSLPVAKFLALFRQFVDAETLDKLEHDLTNFRLEFHTTKEQWIDAYAQESVDSCMTGTDIVGCYVHSQNKLALAALYAPGTNTLVARTIVNTEDKWYVRLFGDSLLLGDKLRELGYNKLSGPPYAFRMYGWAGYTYLRGEYQTPYFDFSCSRVEILHDTHNPDTGLVELIINPDNHP